MMQSISGSAGKDLTNKEAAEKERTLTSDVLYWVEPVSLLGAGYNLVTASVESSAGSDGSVSRHVVYCALRKPVPRENTAGSGQEHREYLKELTYCLKHAGTVRLTPDYGANLETVKQVLEYLAGHRRNFDLELRLFGTIFQQQVWRALRAIPYGATQCYGDIANAVDNPRGARAVGMANNRNPVSLIVPCHRVIGKDGRLVGYGGGLDIKEKLLALEKAVGWR